MPIKNRLKIERKLVKFWFGLEKIFFGNCWKHFFTFLKWRLIKMKYFSFIKKISKVWQWKILTRWKKKEKSRKFQAKIAKKLSKDLILAREFQNVDFCPKNLWILAEWSQKGQNWAAPKTKMKRKSEFCYNLLSTIFFLEQLMSEVSDNFFKFTDFSSNIIALKMILKNDRKATEKRSKRKGNSGFVSGQVTKFLVSFRGMVQLSIPFHTYFLYIFLDNINNFIVASIQCQL